MTAKAFWRTFSLCVESSGLSNIIEQLSNVPAVVTEVLGLRSSRSGFRMLNRIVAQGFVHRNPAGLLVMKIDVTDVGQQ
jgi:hypothetical protein